MTLGSFFLARSLNLPKRRNRTTRPQTVRLKMPDGVALETNIYTPREPGLYPTILMRVPYGLGAFGTVALLYAERGYNVVLQACRGTSRSGGVFEPLRNEREDGLATLDWIKQQPWFDGRLGTSGPSYLGYAQWAISDALPKHSAISVKVSSTEFRSIVFPGGSFQLGLWLGWMQVIELLRNNPLVAMQRMGSGGIEKRTWTASMTLPLTDADQRATGHSVAFWKNWLTGAIGSDAFWEPLDHTHRLGPRTPPTSFVSGWYDFMIDQLLRDYAVLVEAGATPQLTVGPWFHISRELQGEGVKETLTWMDAKLRGDASAERSKPVRLHIGGRNEWREFDAYPPGPPEIQSWHLHPGKVLSQQPVNGSPPDRYTYDPRDPTPNVGGNIFAFTGAGPMDQHPLEKRKDVLVFTSEPLATDTTIIGNVTADIHARANLPNADMFVKLCDVDEDGTSVNICDGIVRHTAADATTPDGIWTLTLKLTATAHCFQRKHRLRVIVASGAHPRFARNTGTDEPFGTATTLRPVEMEIFHDPDHPSALHLPVYAL